MHNMAALAPRRPQGLNDWRNIQSVVRVTFKAFHDILRVTVPPPPPPRVPLCTSPILPGGRPLARGHGIHSHAHKLGPGVM